MRAQENGLDDCSVPMMPGQSRLGGSIKGGKEHLKRGGRGEKWEDACIAAGCSWNSCLNDIRSLR